LERATGKIRSLGSMVGGKSDLVVWTGVWQVAIMSVLTLLFTVTLSLFHVYLVSGIFFFFLPPSAPFFSPQ